MERVYLFGDIIGRGEIKSMVRVELEQLESNWVLLMVWIVNGRVRGEGEEEMRLGELFHLVVDCFHHQRHFMYTIHFQVINYFMLLLI
jgi:hypothetical protein